MVTAKADRVEVPVPDRGLLVLAGLPGAGKSTLLRGYTGGRHATVLDPEQVHRAIARHLPAWVQYRWYRMFVHIGHRARILWYSASTAGPVVAHEPATRASTRGMLVLFGVLTGRSRHLVWLTSTTAQASEGQRRRGRLLARRSFARHVRRAARLEESLRAGGKPRGWQTVRLLRRSPMGSRLHLPRD